MFMQPFGALGVGPCEAWKLKNIMQDMYRQYTIEKPSK